MSLQGLIAFLTAVFFPDTQHERPSAAPAIFEIIASTAITNRRSDILYREHN